MMRLLAVLMTVVLATRCSVPEPCPIGCRCTEMPQHHGRHRWHQLLASYRVHHLLFGPHHVTRAGNRISLNPYPTMTPSGREMTCVGLENMPDFVPPDVSKVTIYGYLQKKHMPQQDRPGGGLSDGGLSGGGLSDGGLSGGVKHVSAYHQLTSVKKYTFRRPNSVEHLVIQANRIKLLHTNDFDMLPSLKILDLKENRIKKIWPRAFRGLEYLTTMDLSKNHLKYLGKTLFYDTPKVEKLLLSSNQLGSLPRSLLKKSKHLSYLDLSDNVLDKLPMHFFVPALNLKVLLLASNHIAHIQPEWFAQLTALEVLSLRGNRISSLMHSIFKPLSSLLDLDLARNDLQYLREGSFNGLRRLEALDLSKNNITNIDKATFYAAQNLRKLDLSSNAIFTLTNETLDGLSTLQYLTLANNKLVKVKAEIFRPVNALTHLDLSYNQIKVITRKNFYGLLELRELRLNHNNIKLIADEAFVVSIVNNFSKLTWLYLQYNKITNISSRMFSGLPYVKFINFCCNEIGSIQTGALAILHRLHTLVLNKNKLTDLEVGVFKHQRSLYHINLGDNDIRQLQHHVLAGLDRAEDINLENNKLTNITAEVFADTPHLTSLNLRRNQLRQFDLSIVDVAHKLRYLDISHNALSHIEAGEGKSRLFMLSLADNSLQTMGTEVLDVMSPGADIHIYGNPWRCDCHLTWLSALQGALSQSDYIICKSPRNLAGEQVFSLKEADFVCPAEEEQSDQTRVTPSLECSIMVHGHRHITEKNIRSSRRDITDWHATLLEQDGMICTGVVLSEDWLVSPSGCWKHTTNWTNIMVLFHNMVMGVAEVFPFPGPVDITMVRLAKVDLMEMPRVYPCILSQESWNEAISMAATAILETVSINKSRKRNKPVRARTIPVHLSSDCSHSHQCFNIDKRRLTKKFVKLQGAFIYVKVGRSTWSVAGISTDDSRSVQPIYPAVSWISDFVHEHLL